MIRHDRRHHHAAASAVTTLHLAQRSMAAGRGPHSPTISSCIRPDDPASVPGSCRGPGWFFCSHNRVEQGSEFMTKLTRCSGSSQLAELKKNSALRLACLRPVAVWTYDHSPARLADGTCPNVPAISKTVTCPRQHDTTWSLTAFHPSARLSSGLPSAVDHAPKSPEPGRRAKSSLDIGRGAPGGGKLGLADAGRAAAIVRACIPSSGVGLE